MILGVLDVWFFPFAYIAVKKEARLENLAFSLNGNHAYEKNVCEPEMAFKHSSSNKYYTFFWQFIFYFCAIILPCGFCRSCFFTSHLILSNLSGQLFFLRNWLLMAWLYLSEALHEFDNIFMREKKQEFLQSKRSVAIRLSVISFF